MIIGTIVDGIVIDHIPAGMGMELYRDLNLDRLDCEVALIKNATSGKFGKKDILKINKAIEINDEILGYVDPRITVNIIRGGVRIEKKNPPLPDRVTNIIFCRNPRCIASEEQELDHIFRLTDRAQGIYRCLYCEMRAERKPAL